MTLFAMKKLLIICIWLFCSSLINASYYEFEFEFDINDFCIQNTDSGCIIIPLNEQYILPEDNDIPGIPFYYTDLLIPISDNINDMSYEIISQQSIFDSVYLYSALLPITTDNNYPLSQYIKRNYSQSRYPIKSVQIIDCKQYNQYKSITLQLSPFIYKTSGELSFISKLSIIFHTDNQNTSTTSIVNNSISKNILSQFVNSPNLIRPTIDHVEFDENIDYLIITSQKLTLAFEKLRKWKTIKGVKTKVISTAQISNNYDGNSMQLKIKNCIKEHVTKNGVKWVLLGGDDTIIPVMGCYGRVPSSNGIVEDLTIPTDMFYACFNGAFDWNANGNDIIGEPDDDVVLIPDVYISRLPVRTAEHIKNYITKLINYEQGYIDMSYLNRMILFGTKLWNYLPSGLSDAQLKSEKMYNNNINPYWNGHKYAFYDTYTDFGANEYDLTPTNINTQINSGYHFMHYAAHGNPTALAAENSDYTINDALALNNHSTPFVFVTMACQTNQFDSGTDPCLSEALIRHSNGGAICYLGSSRQGWGLINTTEPVSLGASFSYNSIFYKKLFNEDIYHFAELVTNAKLYYKSSSTSYGSYRWLQYSLNAIGDPELPIYTTSPLTFNNITITKTDRNLTVKTNGVQGCTIAVTSSEDYGGFYFKVVESTDSATFKYIPNDYNVVVTKHNYVPYIYSNSLYIQNEIFEGISVYHAENVYIGHEVTPLKMKGDVIIKQGSEINIEATNNITLEEGVEVEKGGIITLEIKKL